MRFKLILAILILGVSHLYAQDTVTVFSPKNLKQTDSVLVFKPTEDNLKKYPVVYLLHGHNANYKSWSKLADLQKLANQHQFIIVCPDGLGQKMFSGVRKSRRP